MSNAISHRHEWLTIDQYRIPFAHNCCFYAAKPVVRREPVLQPSDNPLDPDSLAAQFYGTVLYDQDKFRMWYVGMSKDYYAEIPEDDLAEIRSQPARFIVCMGPICYAENEDGWTKPNLGRVLLNGNRDNNAIARHS